MHDVVELLAYVDGCPAVTIKGRYARCLHTLIHAGEKAFRLPLMSRCLDGNTTCSGFESAMAF